MPINDMLLFRNVLLLEISNSMKFLEREIIP